MRILIASTIIPFIEGGGTFIVDWLETKLKEHGHQVDVIKIPFSSNYKKMLSQMMALRLYHLEEDCDRLICIRMPSYLLKHPEKYLWFLHHYREVYDIWETQLDFLPKNDETRAIREYIMRADDVTLKEAKKIYTISQNVTNRLKEYNNIDSSVLYPPIFNPNQYHCNEYGDYIYYVSRICRPKRQDLAIEAMKYTKTNVKLVISGSFEEQSYSDKLYKMIEKNNLGNKVKILDGWIDDKQKIEYFSKCLAAVFIPFNEDYGYVTLEAFHSSKAVISCTDSGATNELIKNNEHGYLVDPDPKQLAEAFDKLYTNKNLATKMGQNSLLRINELGITWDNVVRGLTN